MSAAEHYLRDLLPLLLDRARQARTEELAIQSQGDAESASFQAGRVYGYYEVLLTLLNQLEVFGLNAEKLGLPAELNLEKELL